jgi:hypothetical protein
MERYSENTVALTDAELIVNEWHDALMAKGLNQADALREIEESVPRGGPTWQALRDNGFRAHLLD